ncbi:MAG: LysR family transcriptional regulator [Candidatus Sulfotelmatobacter sp.]
MRVSDRIGHRIKLHDLQVFMTVVQAGSMGKAAGLLNTTQSAISRSMADLERLLGAQLLDRTHRGVNSTRYGDALFKRGTIIFDELKQTSVDIEHLSDPAAGELCVGTSTPQADGIVFAVLKRLSQRHPRISIQVVIGGILDLCEQLRERRIELGCARLSGAATLEDIDEEVLFNDPLVVVAGAKSPWVRRRKIELTDLAGEPWTWTSPGSFTDLLVAEAFRSKGVAPPRATIYVETTSMKIKLAATGRFLAVVPASMLKVRENRALIRKLPVEISATRTQVGIITLKNRMLGPLARLFIECAREVSAGLAGKE